MLAVAWRRPRYDPATTGRPAPLWLDRAVGSTSYAVVLRVLGMAIFLFSAAASVFGKDTTNNPIFGIFYVYWWVGLVPLSLLFGRVYRAISPVRTLHLLLAKLTRGNPEDGVLRYPDRLGYWPASLGLFAFVWLELTYPNRDYLGPVRLWCAAYVAVMLLGGAVFGSTWFARADPFEVYSSLAGRLSVWARRDGVLLVRSPLANLASVVARPGLVAVLAVLFGSTAFDSFADSTVWIQFIQDTKFIIDSPSGPTRATEVALLAFVVGVGVVFAVGCMLTGVRDDALEPAGGPTGGVADAEGRGSRVRRAVVAVRRRAFLPDQLAHSIVPIVVGYIAAHYLTYLIVIGQQTLIQMSDPFSTGADYLGTGDLRINYGIFYHPTLLATLKVLLVVLGHVVGVIAAHDRALELLPPKHRIVGQIPLLVAMIAFTVGGLYLLFAT